MYNVLDGSIMIVMSFYFMYVSKEWLPLEIGCLGLVLIACLLSMVMPESPKYLASKGLSA